MQRRTHDYPALQARLQATHDRFDLWEFRHLPMQAIGERTMPDNPTPTTDFGYNAVPLGAKKPLVRAVFDSVAPRYDLMNDVMSLGVHRIWKRLLVTALNPRPTHTLLDLASGTGVISFGCALRHQPGHVGGRPGPRDRPRARRGFFLPRRRRRGAAAARSHL
jgi:hypothetical protein